MEAGDRNALTEADARRDAGDWPGAAAAYAAHLARQPEDWPIWVQHGHCVKESGDPAGALASYLRAAEGMPGDADLQLQIGHALKLTGDLAGARAAYARSLELDPVGADAWREVSRLLDLPEEPRAAPAGPALVFDVSDLMAWFRRARAPSGIQRVQLGLVGAALADGAARVAVFRPEHGTWRELRRELFRRLAGLATSGADPLDPAWIEARDAAEARLDAGPDLVFPAGAWLVNPGSSWWLPGYHQAVRAARTRHGLRYAALVHDVGPVLAPEHGDPAHAASFARWLTVLGTEADLLLTVSDATRQALDEIARTALAPLPFAPIDVLRPDAAPGPAQASAPHVRAAALAEEPYILFVATIESRKDHLFVLNAWLALLRRHGAALPRLLLVGRAGFGAEPALALLRRAPAFEDRVIWLDDVDDGALAALYRGALFTIYHSQHEGWGLPVTEALAAGKAVITPAHSGLLEAGQGLALHYPAGSEPAFIELVERLAFDPAARTEAEARIAAGLRLRSWAEIAAELATLLAGAPPEPPPPLPAPPLGVAHGLGVSLSPYPSPAMAWSEQMRNGPGWHAPEPWGCRTKPGRAVLRLTLPPEATGLLRLHLALRGAAEPRRVALRAGRAGRILLEVPAAARPVAVLELAHATGLVEMVVEVEAGAEDPETGIGVVALMACAPDDVAARLGFLERLSFVWPEPA